MKTLGELLSSHDYAEADQILRSEATGVDPALCRFTIARREYIAMGVTEGIREACDSIKDGFGVVINEPDRAQLGRRAMKKIIERENLPPAAPIPDKTTAAMLRQLLDALEVSGLTALLSPDALKIMDRASETLAD